MSTADHPFVDRPNKTLAGMAIPALFSLVAEPLTGLADTAFVARLPGAEPVAALGIGAVAFSSVFWAFMFLNVGAQTVVSQSLGRDDRDHAVKFGSLAVCIGLAAGFLLMLGIGPFLTVIADLLGGRGEVKRLAEEYMAYRLFGAPAILASFACFGILRGTQDMRTPLWIAVGVNALNIILDWLLVFGVGPFPAMGVGGAALASSVSQWFGALWALFAVRSKLGFTLDMRGAGVKRLLDIGGNLFVRTGLVLVFLALCTRIANKAGAEPGAAHQAIRQFFIFSALFLDAFAVSGQSLVGFFIGANNLAQARRVARYVCLWSFGTGCLLCIAMLAGSGAMAWLLVPPEAVSVFGPAWLAVALLQPLSAMTFATDGVHWGTGDFRYLRNAMATATAVGAGCVIYADAMGHEPLLVWVWLGTGVWTVLRAGFGLARIWPGWSNSPLASERKKFT